MKSLTIRGEKVYCFDPKYQKVMRMGTKIGDVFFKSVEAKNFMVVVNGYGLQYDAFGQFEINGIKKIEVLEKETGHTWLSTVEDWRQHGKVADYGRGKQVFLSLKYMHLKDKAKEKADYEKRELNRSRVNEETLLGFV